MNPEENNNPLNTDGSAPAVPTTPVEPVAPTEPAAPFGAVESMPTEQPAPEVSSTSPAPAASFVGGDLTNESEGPEEPKESEEPQPPIEPAAPLPGSIGSAVSGPAATPEPAPATPATPTAPAEPATPANPTAPAEPAAPAQPAPVTPTPDLSSAPIDLKPKKSSRTLTIVLAAVAALIVIAGVVVFILVSQQSKNNVKVSENEPEETPIVEEPVETALVCKATVEDAEQLANISEGLTKYTSEMVANYLDDEFVDISVNEQFTFSAAELAQNYLTVAQANYTSIFSELGFESDPAKSAFNNQDLVSTISHSITASKLNANNMVIFALQTQADTEEVDTSSSAIKKIYEGLSIKHTCVLGEVEETEEEPEETEE